MILTQKSKSFFSLSFWQNRVLSFHKSSTIPSKNLPCYRLGVQPKFLHHQQVVKNYESLCRRTSRRKSSFHKILYPQYPYSVPQKKKKTEQKVVFFVTYYLSCDCQRNCNCKKNQRNCTDQPLFLGRTKKQQLVREKVEI